MTARACKQLLLGYLYLHAICNLDEFLTSRADPRVFKYNAESCNVRRFRFGFSL